MNKTFNSRHFPPEYQNTGKGIFYGNKLQLLDFPGIYGERKAPWGPRAYIALKAHATVKWRSKNGRKEIDFPVISQESVTADEFHYHVQRLIKELEEIDKKATRFFARDAEKRAAWMEARKSKKRK